MSRPPVRRCVAAIDVGRPGNASWEDCNRFAVHLCEACGGAFCSTHIDEHPHVRREAGSIVPWAAAMRNNDDQGWSPVR